MKYKQIVSDEVIKQTIEALQAGGMGAEVVETKEAARAVVLDKIMSGSEVMTMSSETLNETGIATAINDSSDYISIRSELMKMNRETDSRKMQVTGAAPQVAVGSAQAVTTKGELVFASKTGSQLPAYAYGADQVIIVVGAQKIVADLDEAMKRVYDYVLPLESVRANKAYGITTGSNVSKLLIISNEIKPGRVHVVIVKEVLGF